MLLLLMLIISYALSSLVGITALIPTHLYKWEEVLSKIFNEYYFSYRAVFIIFSTYSLFTPYSCAHTHVYYHAERINQMTLSGLKLNLLGAMLLELLLKWLMPPLAGARRPLASLCVGPWAGHELSIPGTQRKDLRAGGYSALRCGSLVASNPSEQGLRQKTTQGDKGWSCYHCAGGTAG